MLLRNVVLPDKGELMGHFIVESRKRTKSASGVRVVPMEPAARDTTSAISDKSGRHTAAAAPTSRSS